MNRKKFIESQGATCRNWTWSWSFINENQKIIIFGAWDRYAEGNMSMIFSEEWSTSSKGKKPPGYDQSREHIRLIEEEGYKLMTFPMKYSDEKKDVDGVGPAKIEGFEPILTQKTLKRVGGKWYASDDVLTSLLPEEIDEEEKFIEGASKTVSVNSYERNPDARATCILHHGYKCVVCGFNFETFYGEIGKNFIHVHHVIPLSEIGIEYELNPIKDLMPVCPNCHAIIHRTRPALTVEQLRKHLADNGKNT